VRDVALRATPMLEDLVRSLITEIAVAHGSGYNCGFQ
jgi:hypothetical protein